MTFRLNKDQRITEIDFVRGLCILAVHIGHCSIDLGAVTYLWQSFFMSAFFIFSGYLSKSKPSSLLKLLKSTLLLYYLWTIGLHALMAFQDIRHGTFSLPVWISELKPIFTILPISSSEKLLAISPDIALRKLISFSSSTRRSATSLQNFVSYRLMRNVWKV